MCRGVQLDFTPEMEELYILFGRYYGEIRYGYLKHTDVIFDVNSSCTILYLLNPISKINFKRDQTDTDYIYETHKYKLTDFSLRPQKLFVPSISLQGLKENGENRQKHFSGWGLLPGLYIMIVVPERRPASSIVFAYEQC